jgi:peroxiredoxin Q/BCP
VGVIRSTVVADPEGKILRHYRNVRAKGHAARVLREVGAE